MENRLLEFSEIINEEYHAFMIYKLLHHIEVVCKNGTILNFAAMMKVTIDDKWMISEKWDLVDVSIYNRDVGEMKNEILKLLLDESNGYSPSSDNIASIQNIIDNNVAKHDVVTELNRENSLDIISHPFIQVIICFIIRVCWAMKKKGLRILLIIVSKDANIDTC
jgi:hypothetical protein